MKTGGAPRETRTTSYRRLTAAIVYYVLILGGGYFLLSRGIISWPFQRRSDFESFIPLILAYSPVAALSALSLLWLRSSEEGIGRHFKWERFSAIFLVGLAASLGYSEYLLEIRAFGLSHYGNWLPVIILGVLNSFSEEIFFRLVLHELALKALNNPIAANVLQANLYSIVHFFIGGWEFGLPAFAYGLLLGVVRDKNQSLTPCLICHFAIDLGCIGAPMLSRG